MIIFLDIAVFVAFIAAVISIGILMSRGERDSESYFLAGRGLSWYLIGFSLIAANISTEQFVGMSGSSAGPTGLAIASYEWMAAITLVIVAFFFLPAFLRAGIYTMPEFLEHRYNHFCRSLMSLFMMIIYVGVTIAAVIYSGALTVDVLFGDITIAGMQPVNVTTASWVIGILAAVYVAAGGLKACAWADLLQGSALIVGGAVVVYFAMKALGVADPATIGLTADAIANTDAQSGVWATAVSRFQELNGSKMHMVLPSTDQVIPWTALLVGLWIPNLYYWGLNQYITQRTLGASSLGEGQKGVVFAAGLKLVIPFIIVIPGIIAFNLYSGDMAEQAMISQDANAPTLAKFEAVSADPSTAGVAFEFDADFAGLQPELSGSMLAFNAAVAGIDVPADGTVYDQNTAVLAAIAERNKGAAVGSQVAVQKRLMGYKFDAAFGLLIKKLIPPGLRGFMLAAILGAVMSSLASMLNAASTIFTMDIYKEYLNRNASEMGLVFVGRFCVALFVVIGCLISPLLGDPRLGGIFNYIQEFQGFISPGILAVFLFGLFVKRVPAICGIIGLLFNPIIYGVLKFAMPNLAFLDRMAVSFALLMALMGLITLVMPARETKEFKTKTDIDLKPSGLATFGGIMVVYATIVLYMIFR